MVSEAGLNLLMDEKHWLQEEPKAEKIFPSQAKSLINKKVLVKFLNKKAVIFSSI